MSDKNAATKTQVSPEKFVTEAIVKLRKGEYKGIHSVFSGFNEAFKAYYNGADPREATTALQTAGKIAVRPVKGGVMLYLPADAPTTGHSAAEALAKMGL